MKKLLIGALLATFLVGCTPAQPKTITLEALKYDDSLPMGVVYKPDPEATFKSEWIQDGTWSYEFTVSGKMTIRFGVVNGMCAISVDGKTAKASGDGHCEYEVQ